MAKSSQQKKDKTPGNRRTRDITNKYDVYKVPLSQMQNPIWTPSGLYQPKLQPIQPESAQMLQMTVPSTTYTYNYESYGTGPVPPGPSTRSGPYFLPQMDPNYYSQAQGVDWAFPTSFGIPLSILPKEATKYGGAPYSSPWADGEQKEPRSRPALPLSKRLNNDNVIMHKLQEIHSQMKKMCNLLTEEINAQKAFRGQVPSSRSIGVDIERFNQLLSQFNQMCNTLKQKSRLSGGQHNSPAPSSLITTRSKGPNVSAHNMQTVQSQPTLQMAQLDQLFQQARALGVELHNKMLDSIALPVINSKSDYSSSSFDSP